MKIINYNTVPREFGTYSDPCKYKGDDNKSEPPEYEYEVELVRAPDEEWKSKLADLQALLQQYQCERARADLAPAERARMDAQIADVMRGLSEQHTDPMVKTYWCQRAYAFAMGTDKEKDTILDGVGRGLLILLATPFAVAGAVIFAAGSIVYGTGTLIAGIGTLLTCGRFQN